MAEGVATVGVEPERWYLIFETRAPARWLRWIAMGRFKHVSALGWLPEQRLWVHYDVRLGRTRVAVLPDCQAAADRVHELREHAVTVVFTPVADRRRWLRLGFWCVPAMAHLVGVKGTPLRPDALFRLCLEQGGAIRER